ncbi:MAG: response regulator [Deltaproteobacteria bacterium]|nr:response regulator [Deltaproteobacteria bacterium]
MKVKKHILVVEDNRDVLDVIRTILERLGHDVSLATNGKEGVEMARQQCPDLVVMDILMPIMDGFQAISLIKENPQTRTVPILAVTALQGERERCFKAGFDGYMTKPFTVDELEATVERLLKRQQPAL